MPKISAPNSSLGIATARKTTTFGRSGIEGVAKKLLIDASVRFAELSRASIAASKDRSEVICTPRYSYESTTGTFSP
jgi:hypothetical protein